MSFKKTISRFVILLGSFSLTLSTSALAQSANQFHVDEIEYCQQLFAARPDIMDQPSKEGEAINALIIRPAFRSLMLKAPNTFESIRSKYCTAAYDRANTAWVLSQQNAETALENDLLNQFHKTDPTGSQDQFLAWLKPQNRVKMGGYPIDEFVAYWVGVNKNLYVPLSGPNGQTQYIDCKLFFTFLLPGPFSDVTPAVYRGFADQLLAAGFTGDFKAYATKDQVFMVYNQIICHAGSIANAELAERVGLNYFGSKLIHESRGIDQNTANGALDYHQYLFEHRGSISALPVVIQKFLRYQK